MASSFDKFKELNLSRDEVNRIGEALKNKEFRKLLTEYVEELEDPKNKQLFEEEIKELEKERGNEVTFLHPNPGYVIKTSVNGQQKGFLNVCINENIRKPSSSPAVKDGGRGLQWSLPHSLSPPREDIDNKGARCQVFDILFHPDTLRLASSNNAFRDMVNSTALEAVESNFDVSLDKKNLKFPKLNYKGVPRACIVRKPLPTQPIERSSEEKELLDKLYSHIPSNNQNKPKKLVRKNLDDNSTHTTPKYIIKHRSHVDIQEFTEHREAKVNAAIPKELIVEIDLPLLKSSSDMNLDVTEKTVQLSSEKPAKYKLNLTLPYQVNEAAGSAKFDKDLKRLVVTLPVKRRSTLDCKDDSGVESDANSPSTPESEEEVGDRNIVRLESDPNGPDTPESEEISDKFIGVEDVNESEEIGDKKIVCEVEPSEQSVETSNHFRTNCKDEFLDENLHYSLPEFSCHVFENVIAFTLHVKNVDESTLVNKISSDNSSVRVKFISISPSFYPSHYTFCVKFPTLEIDKQKLSIETWDNNVIVQVPLIVCDTQIKTYFYGINEKSLTEKCVEELPTLNKVLEKATVAELLKPVQNAIEEMMEKPSKKQQSQAIDIMATSYESSGDELSGSSFSPRKSKGILKRMSARSSSLGRSISESSLDEFVCSSYENCHKSLDCGIPEDEEMSTSLKKTVRFNDVVTRQLFRSNSSILGQKKKNQRKARNKKRAHDRRHSESEASDMENKKEEDLETRNEETESDERESYVIGKYDRKYDHDIFQLEIND